MRELAADTAHLETIVHGDWTVAVALSHLAYWDRFVLALLGRWRRGEDTRFEVPGWYDHLLNDAAGVDWKLLKPADAANGAVQAAAAVDDLLDALDDDEHARLSAEAAQPELDVRWLLQRYHHREEHLAAIDAGLGR
jgi:hypothetical protein